MKRSELFTSFVTFSIVLLLVLFLTRDTSTSISKNKSTDYASSSHDQFANLDEVYKRLDELERKWQTTSKKLEELSCRLQDVGTRGGFCLTKNTLEVGGNWAWDLTLAQSLDHLFRKQVVGDFGAGLGWYGRYFLRKRERYFHTAPTVENKYFFDDVNVTKLLKLPQEVANWEGYDGATFVEEVTNGLVKNLDLSEPFLLPNKFDWILSLEVGEHIPAEFEQNFVNNLDKHACKGIVLSWAVLGQGGHHHVNNRPREYVVAEMAKRGFKYDEEWSKRLRNVASLPWLRDTVMVYKRETFLQHPHCPNSP